MSTKAISAPVKNIAAKRYVSPARASQMLSHALGHGYSRQSVVRLLESGALAGHQMTPRGRWWILSRSLRVYVESVLRQQSWERNGFGEVDHAAVSECSTRWPM